MARLAAGSRLLAALLLFFPLLHAIEPVTNANFATFLHITMDGKIVTVKATYIEASYYSQPNPEEYPVLNDPFSFDLFYKPCLNPTPPNPSCEFSQDDFKFTTGPLANAPIDFTFNDQPVTCVSGNPYTNFDGMAICVLDEYGGSDFDDLKSCGSVGVGFGGMYTPDGKTYYQPSSRSAIYCSATSEPLSALGTAIFNSLSSSSHVFYCFPVILIAGLLVSSMYYSGRDPLSLFDLTTPRLPRVKQFRVKQGTAPQMMRSILRRYLLMQIRAERDIIASAKLVAKAQYDELEKKGRAPMESKREYARNAAEQAREVLRDYKRKLRVASATGKALPTADYEDARAKLNRIFDNLAPVDKNGSMFKRYKYTRELIDGWLQIHQLSEQASKLTGAARGGGGGQISRWLDRRLVSNKKGTGLTELLVKFEDTRFARMVARIPVVSVLVTGPAKTFDALMQFRATRRGHKALRRNLGGAILYNTLLSSKDSEDKAVRKLNPIGRVAQRIFDTGAKDAKGNAILTPLGKAVNWWNKWTFEKFEKQVNLTNKKMNEIFHVAEDLRLNSGRSLQAYFNLQSTSIFGFLVTLDNTALFEEAIEKDLKAGRGDARKLRALLAKISGATINESSRDAALKDFIKLIRTDKEGYKNLRAFFLESMENRRQLRAITKELQQGKITQADYLERMCDLLPDKRAANAVINPAKIEEFRKLEAIVRDKLLFRLKDGVYEQVDFEKINSERSMALKRDEATHKAIEQLRKQMGDDDFLKLSALQVQKALVDRGLASAAVQKHIQTVDNDLAKKYRMGDELAKKYGSFASFAALSKSDFEKLRNDAYTMLLRDTENNRGVLHSLKSMSDETKREIQKSIAGINFGGDENQLRRAERQLQEALFRMNMFGNSTTGLYLSEKLGLLGIVDSRGRKYNIKTLDDLELAYKKGAQSETMHFNFMLEKAVLEGRFGTDAQRKLDRLLTAQERAALLASDVSSLNQLRQGRERATQVRQIAGMRGAAYGTLVLGAGKFAQVYDTRLWTATSILTGSPGDVKKALRDFLGNNAANSVLKTVAPAERMEVSLKRSDFDISAYSKDTEADLGLARGFEKFTGQIVGRGTAGATWGDNSLSKLSNLMKQQREDVGVVRAMYLNLINENSKFYDKKFATDVKGREFGVEAYLALIERGRTFADMRRGIPFIQSGDERGGIPMLEWNEKVLAAQGKGIIVKKDGDIRDLTPLLARMSESWYGNLPLGMSILVRHQKADGSVTWVYGDPNKDPETRNILAAARGAINLREVLGNTLAGYDPESGIYDSSMQRIKVISTNDLQKYAKTNEGGFFGDMRGADYAREWLRSKGYGFAQMMTTPIYSGLSDRLIDMRKWYAAQMQIRFALGSLAAHTEYSDSSEEGFMKAGTDRFKLDLDGKETKKEMDKRNYDAALRKEIEKQMQLIKLGDNSFTGNMESSWYNFRRNISAKTAKEVADAESKWYAIKTELQAIEKLHELGKISFSEYASHKAIAQSALDDAKAEMKAQRKDYKDLVDAARVWTGSHTSMHEYGYGGIKNPFTMFSLPAMLLDSKWQQGLKLDYYQTAESSVMRDPRNAIGAGPGLDYSFYVGYQTGQNVYERMSMWGVNALWETSAQNRVHLTIGAHKWFNDYLSYAMRKSSAYPAWYEMDAMYPGQHGKRSVSAGFLFPFQSHHHTDYFHARFQNFLNYSGTGALIGSYMLSGSQDPSQRSFIKKNFLDKMFLAAPTPTDSHYGEHVTWKYLQRPVEQFRQFQSRLDSIIARDVLENGEENSQWLADYIRWRSLNDGSEEKIAIWKERFEPIVKIYDRRPRGTQEGHSGRDIQEDGSRNRFMELYQGFHTNVWKPTIPGMLDVDPISGKWKPFPQSAAFIDKTTDERLRSMASFTLSRYNKETGLMEYEDKFDTHMDAYRDVYKKEDSALLHLAKLQSELSMYSVINSPALWFFGPALGLARTGIGAAFKATDSKFGSNLESSRRRLQNIEGVYGGGQMPGYDSFVEQVTGYKASELHATEEPSRLYAKWLSLRSYFTAEKYKDYYHHAARTRLKPWYPLLGKDKEEELRETQEMAKKTRGF